ncbi:lipid A export permease/ATP-binding protein MsbA [Candidatus Magnetaquicoccus inordinatus]|uniref:lipid A export permease/ATP-binding protein MsbA n=1 Tax=Candidatus Magnetaquicoccus inordinatus TaxID=2496818 RepID=UPI001D0ED762|nr:lipid A export permease/ATP-binding protein MsbA [Candidatus Magnetaquicoccus inordinatus]
MGKGNKQSQAARIGTVVPAVELDNRQLIRRFLRLVLPYWFYLLPAFICMLILAGTNGAIAFLVQPILDKVFIEQDTVMLANMPMIILTLFVVRGAVYFAQIYLMENAGQRVVRNLQVQLYGHLMAMDLAYFQNNATGNIMSHITYDTNMLKGAGSSVITNLLREGFTVIFLLGVLFYRDWQMALVSLIGLPLAGVMIYRFGRRMRRLSQTRQELMGEMTSHLEESIAGQRIVKAFGMERYERARFRLLNRTILINTLRTAKVKAFSSPSMDLIAGVAVSAVILYGGRMVMNGQTTTGAFFSFITALLMAYDPIKSLTTVNNQLQESMAAARRLFAVMDLQPAIQDHPDAVALPPLRQEIQFEQVGFRYRPELPPVLTGITLRVRAGERVALVGHSGSGKTTLVNLVPRFFDVIEGAICVDGQDIRLVTQRSLRAQIAVVTQDVILFNDTIRNNILYGDRNRSDAEVRQAAQAANALEFIEAMPEGFATVIGDRGIRLSGGQRQRLSIARSLLKNAPILILDEATSALDTESERLVQEALERLMEGRTSLVIAHRLSTIRNVDRIVVLREGRIVEEGSHAELLAKGGEYARFHYLQFQQQETLCPVAG